MLMLHCILPPAWPPSCVLPRKPRHPSVILKSQCRDIPVRHAKGLCTVLYSDLGWFCQAQTPLWDMPHLCFVSSVCTLCPSLCSITNL